MHWCSSFVSATLVRYRSPTQSSVGLSETDSALTHGAHDSSHRPILHITTISPITSINSPCIVLRSLERI
ncbi:hypothetical protein NXS19_003543 [Fusarium pseudograminearum]|nr:hypothetical protein NXS19_003543 [Fusarium pseudograminearum]